MRGWRFFCFVRLTAMVLYEDKAEGMPGLAGSVAPSQAAPRYPPGDPALWIFILAELLVFAIFFTAYAFSRMNNVELFNQFQATLNRDAALINTLALLTSSYLVVHGAAATAPPTMSAYRAGPATGTWSSWYG